MNRPQNNEVIVTVSLDFIRSLEQKINLITEKLDNLSTPGVQHQDQLLSRLDAIELLGISRDTFRTYMNEGLLKVHKVGRKIFVRRSEIEKMMDEHTL